MSRHDLASLEPVAPLAEAVNPESASSTMEPQVISAKAAPADGDSSETPVVCASVPAAEIALGETLYEAPLREMHRGGALFTSDLLKQDPQLAGSVEMPSECPAPDVCIDDYLWALYQRAPKVDTNRLLQRVKVKTKVSIKKNNKKSTVTKTVIKTNIKYVVGASPGKIRLRHKEPACL